MEFIIQVKLSSSQSRTVGHQCIDKAHTPLFCLQELFFFLPPVHLMNYIHSAQLRVEGSKPLPSFKHPSTANTQEPKLSILREFLSFMLINEQAIRGGQWFHSVLAWCWGWGCWRKPSREGQSLTDLAHAAFVCSPRCFKTLFHHQPTALPSFSTSKQVSSNLERWNVSVLPIRPRHFYF